MFRARLRARLCRGKEGLHRAPTFVRQFGGYIHHLLLFLSSTHCCPLFHPLLSEIFPLLTTLIHILFRPQRRLFQPHRQCFPVNQESFGVSIPDGTTTRERGSNCSCSTTKLNKKNEWSLVVRTCNKLATIVCSCEHRLPVFLLFFGGRSLVAVKTITGIIFGV